MAEESAKLENPTEGTQQVRKGRSRFISLTRAFGRTQSPQHSRGPTWTKRVLCQIGRWMLRLRYRVRLEGMQAIQEKGRTGILFLPNHPALIDPPIMVTYLYQHFAVRPLAAAGAINKPLVRSLAKIVHVISIPEISEIEKGSADRVQRAITLCVEALRRGENILLYPSGQLMREQITNMGSASAVERIVAELPEVRLVLVRTTGLWGSSFSWASGAAPQLGRAFTAHLGDLLLSGIIFVPKRRVRIVFTEPGEFPRHTGRAVMDRYMEAFFNQEAPPARYVPYSIWQRGGEHDLPAPPPKPEHQGEAIPPATEKLVLDYLRELTNLPDITTNQQLSRDLGLDSLAIQNVIVWLEKEFGVTVGTVESLESVNDVMLAACGKLVATTEGPAIPMPGRSWTTNNSTARAQLPAGRTIQEVFLTQARRHPAQVVVADIQTGCKKYRDLITSIFALREEIHKLPGERVGIMLPASVAADMAFLAVLFSGKTPVMVNWTTGLRNITTGLELAGVQKVLTANALLSRLQSQGIDLSALGDRMLPLETLAASLGRWGKLSAAIKARGSWRSLDRPAVTDIAVILFTSGSEALPKAVPLTHENLLTNIRDSLDSFYVRQDDRLIGMLPPFHSFGLNASMLLPILGGGKVVHYPNPNDVAALVHIIENYRVSILLGTPTFLSNIVRGSGKNSLATLRICVTGAEKCPQSVYDALKKSCPRALILEGYGITECSPIVSVAREDDIRPGSIGIPLPSVQWAIVDEATQQRAAPDQAGMLLVRGPSIFKGYLGEQNTSPFVQWSGESWYRTGDLIKADATGHLTFVGRLKRFVKLGGEMISLPAIEDVLERKFPSPANSGPALAVIAKQKQENPELVLISTRTMNRAEVNQAIRDGGLSGLHQVRSIVQVDRLPVLGTGKIDYRALENMVKAS
ncbi:MAG: AMP-binding protein [Phycisphaerae bacterium]